MKAVTVSFDRDGSTKFKTLLGAFVNSWKANASIPLEVHYYAGAPKQQTRSYTFDSNHYKFGIWRDSLDGDTIFVDSDMICQQDITCGFDLVDHIGITERRGKYPYNGGVVFVRDTPQAKAFIDKWYEIDREMMGNPTLHNKYHLKYAGMNQSSLGWMLENGYRKHVTVLPEKYNMCEPWDEWRDAYMIHLKGWLRHSVFEKNPPARHADLVQLWRTYAR